MRRILIDGTMARGGGGFTYLLNVLPKLSRLAREDRFLALVRSERLVEALEPLSNVEVRLLPSVNLAQRLLFAAHQASRIAGEWRADFYFSVADYLPFRCPCPAMAAFRNPNIFTDLEQGWWLGQRVRFAALRLLASYAVRRADRIMFVSADSASWIGEAMGIPPEKRVVVHHGMDASAWLNVTEPSPHPDDYILSVSSIYRYKNFVRLIQAYAALLERRDDLPDLVIIGDNQDEPYAEQMRQAREAMGRNAQRVHILGEVPYTAIKPYFAGARLFVFPSYLETFGHPLLEAMVSRVPLLAADIGVFREVAGDAALYADPYDVNALAGAMESLLGDEPLRARLVQRGVERAKLFTWDRSAQELMAAIDAILAGT